MDTIDFFVSLAALLVIVSIVMQMGAECASNVWKCTVAELGEIDFLEGNTVPFTTAGEAVLISVAALLKMAAILPLTLTRAFTQKTWRVTPEVRLARLRDTLRTDILLAVFSMISGYPERAALLYLDALRERLAESDGAVFPAATPLM